MVSEMVCWFAERGSTPAVVTVRVTAPDEVEAGRYPVEVVPTRPGSIRFQKSVEDVRAAIAVRAWNVIATKRQDLFEKTLDSLRDAGHPFDLFLVDNGSTDGTSELVRERGGYASLHGSATITEPDTA